MDKREPTESRFRFDRSRLQSQGTRRVAAEFIKELVFEGHLVRGDRVPQDAVAAAMGVSITPVREALIALEQEGLVTMQLHRGAFINSFDAQSVRDQYELYGFIFGWAVRRTTERATPEVLGELGAVRIELERATSPEDLPGLVARFTELLNDIGGSRDWRRFLDTFPRLVPGNFYERVPGAAASAQRRLPAVVDAVERRDADRAVESVHAMMREHGELILAELQRRNLLSPGLGLAGGDVRPAAASTGAQ